MQETALQETAMQENVHSNTGSVEDTLQYNAILKEIDALLQRFASLQTEKDADAALVLKHLIRSEQFNDACGISTL